ncbi:MAG: CapA family protein [Eubacteriales bacterium]
MKKLYLLLPLLMVLLVFGCGKSENHAKANEKITKNEPLVLDTPLSEDDYTEESRISFAAAGDNIIHEAVFTDAAAVASVYASDTGKKTEYRFADMYAGIADIISSADFSYVNHETPVAGKSYGISGYPDFNAPEEVGNDLAEVGFDIINIANNHMLDMGEGGLENSIKYWNGKSAEKGLTVIGGYTKEDYDAVRFIQKNGIKVALLSYTTFINYSHVNSLSSGSDLIIPYANEADMRRQVQLAKDGGADFIIVAMHWGDENAFSPNTEQEKYASILANLGVDVILGSHSHTLQPLEWIDGTGGHRTLCIYSLGNLLSTMLYDYYMVGGILTFDLVKDKDGNTSVENPILIPIMCHYSMTRDSLKIYKLEDYTEELAKAHGAQKNGAFTLGKLYSYVTGPIEDEFLPEFLQ